MNLIKSECKKSGYSQLIHRQVTQQLRATLRNPSFTAISLIPELTARDKLSSQKFVQACYIINFIDFPQSALEENFYSRKVCSKTFPSSRFKINLIELNEILSV